VTQLVRFPVEAERLLAVRFVGNDGLGTASFQPVPQIGAVIGSISKELLGGLRSPDQALRWRAIMRFAAGQQEGKRTAFSICDCMDFRIAPAA